VLTQADDFFEKKESHKQESNLGPPLMKQICLPIELSGLYEVGARVLQGGFGSSGGHACVGAVRRESHTLSTEMKKPRIFFLGLMRWLRLELSCWKVSVICLLWTETLTPYHEGEPMVFWIEGAV